MMDKMKDMKTKKRTLKKGRKKKNQKRKYVIRAENVDYTYEGSKIKALDHLSLNIRKGKKSRGYGRKTAAEKSLFFLCLNGIRKTGIRKDFYRWKTDRIYKKKDF